MNGRHFILLGIIACAGLLSVKEGQEQIDVCYRIGALEKDLRGLRADIELCKVKFQALQSPKAVATRAAELKLKVGPVALASATPDALLEPRPATPEPPRSLGSAHGTAAVANRTVKAH